MKLNGVKTKLIVIVYATIFIMITLLYSAKIINADYNHYSYSSGPNGFATATINKRTSSSVYVQHYGQKPARIQVRSNGVSYSNSVLVQVNSNAHIQNWVYENGKRNCYLYITPSSGSAMLYGDWYSDI